MIANRRATSRTGCTRIRASMTIAAVLPLLPVLLSLVAGSAGSAAEANGPLAVVTAVEDGTVYLMPTGNGAVAPGAELRVVRDGRTIAAIVVCAGEPLHAEGRPVSPEEPVAIGDPCYAPGSAIPSPPTQPPPEPRPPAPSPPPPQPASNNGAEPPEPAVVATVSAVDGALVYLTPSGQNAPSAGEQLAIRDGADVADPVVAPVVWDACPVYTW